MSTPASLIPSPVVSLGTHSYSLLDDDYGVNKLTFKAKATSSARGVFNFKLAQDLVKNSQTQEVKIQFPFRQFYVWAGFRPTEYKFHIDLGEYQVLKKLSLYTNAKYLENGKHVFKFGATHDVPACHSHTRLEYQNDDFSFTSRALAREKDFRFGFAGTYNINKNEPSRYDFLLGLIKPDFDLFLRHYSTSKSSLKLGRVLGNVTYRVNKQHTLGLEVELDGKQNPQVTVGNSATINGVTLKAKANLIQQNLFFSAKGKIDDKFQLTVSGQLPVGKSYNNNTIFPVPLAVTLEATL